MYHHTQLCRYLSLISGCCLILLLVACGSTPPTATGHTPTAVVTLTQGITPETSPTPGAGTTAVPMPVVTTVPMPPTQTSCPATGTARAAVMVSLALGQHQNVIYTITTQGATGPASTSTLYRYDVTTGTKTQIMQVTHESIDEAQISSDGQWILFVTSLASQPDKLQLIRMDGQGLQTLYCGFIALPQWSTDLKRIVFYGSSAEGGGALDLLNTQSGRVQQELDLSSPLPTYFPVTWLDTTRLYLHNPGVDAPANRIFILDTGKGANQTPGDLISVFQVSPNGPYAYVNFDSSYDGETLFVCQYANQRGSSGGTAPPSAISTLPATGGVSHAIYTSSTLAISTIRVINRNSLFLLIENLAIGATSQNGLWKLNVGGSGLTRLATLDKGTESLFNQTSQFPWSNFSRDSSFYAVWITTSQGLDSLIVGSLHGGSPTTFESADAGTTQISIVGWTTM